MKQPLGLAIFLLALLCIVGAGVALAAGEQDPADGRSNSVWQVPVLVMAYYPPDPSNPDYLDPMETGWVNTRVSDMMAATAEMVTAGQAFIGEATRYHGYKEPAAPMFLSYYTYAHLDFIEPMPRGYLLSEGKHRPHYGQMMRDINICDYVDTNGIKEVWLYGYHSDVIEPDESKMSSKYGDISNALPRDENVPQIYRLPRCGHSYVLYNFTYQPGGEAAIGNTIHNRMHQIENVVFFAENRGYPPTASNTIDSMFWDDFSVRYNRDKLPDYRASCGNAHRGANTTDEYDYDSLTYRENNCETWHADDSLTTYELANCKQWGCTDMGFYKWYMQNMPGYDNGIVFEGKLMRNWWEAMLDYDAFIDRAHSLFLTAPGDNSSLFLPVIVGPVPGYTSLVSVTPAGHPGNGKSFGADVSGDGRYVGFTSAASDLVPGDTNDTEDVFVRDLVTGETTRVSVASDGLQAAYHSFYPSLSHDGRYVAFQSFASDFVPESGLPSWDIFVHDRVTGITEIVSVSSSGEPGDSDSHFPEISADGRYVAFESRASNLAGPNPDNLIQALVYDRQLKTTLRVPSASGHSKDPALSGDGRFVAYTSSSPDLVPSDTNGVDDVFVYDQLTGQTERVSVGASGAQGDRRSFAPSISYDGRFVGFTSRSTTLAPDDESEFEDMFVRDRVAGTTARVTINDDGSDANQIVTYAADLAGYGRHVVVAWASYIVVRDWQNSRTIPVSVAADGTNVGGAFPDISADGRAIVYESLSDELDSNDTNDEWDIYIFVYNAP